MTGPKIGELFAGYGGLGMGVQAALGGEIAWVSEYDKGPSKILAHRFPGVPNHGDITKIKWTPDCPTCGEPLALYDKADAPEGRGYYCPADGWFDLSIRTSDIPDPVDILTGGSPCQDLSHAGKRAGMTDGTRSNLWVAMREAIAALRPSLVVWENVRGAYSACADSEMGRCPRCVDPGAPGGHDPRLRALGRVLGDLSDLGYDASWHGLRAADIGAPHGRFRVFVVAYPAVDAGRVEHGDRGLAAVAAHLGHERGGASRDGRSGPEDSDRGPLTVLPTPSARDWKDHTIRREPHRPDDTDTLARALTVTLLPTPAVNDMGAAYTPDEWDAWCETQKAKHGNGNGHGKSLHIEAARLLPTPTASDSHASGGSTPSDVTLTDATVRTRMGTQDNDRLLPTPRGAAHRTGRSAAVRKDSMSAPSLGQAIEIADGILPREFESWEELPPSWQPDTSGVTWGQYAAAVHRWEAINGPAPAPTELGPKGNPRLSARFSEWMMGLPAGWVTDVPGITRNEALKALGNGVVPQQAAAALWIMLAREVAA